MSDATNELAEVARIMSEHRLDSVKLPSGLEVLKTTHLPYEATPVSPDDVEEAVERRLRAAGQVLATEETGRIPADEEEIMFAASRLPPLSPQDFRPDLGQPSTEEEHVDADE
jgi:hypothetical protein